MADSGRDARPEKCTSYLEVLVFILNALCDNISKGIQEFTWCNLATSQVSSIAYNTNTFFKRKKK